MNVHKIQLAARTSCVLPAKVLAGPIDYIKNDGRTGADMYKKTVWRKLLGGARDGRETCVRA